MTSSVSVQRERRTSRAAEHRFDRATRYPQASLHPCRAPYLVSGGSRFSLRRALLFSTCGFPSWDAGFGTGNLSPCGRLLQTFLFISFRFQGLFLLSPRAASQQTIPLIRQVLDHLTIMILRMEEHDNGDSERVARHEDTGLRPPSMTSFSR